MFYFSHAFNSKKIQTRSISKFSNTVRIAFFLLGILLMYFNESSNHLNHFAKNRSVNNILSMQITEPPKTSDKTIHFTGEVLAIKQDEFVPSYGKIKVYLERSISSESLEYGDQILLHGRIDTLESIKNPGSFDYAQFLASKGIYHRIYADSASWSTTFKGQGNLFKKLALQSRSKITQFLAQNQMMPRELAVANALILGDKSLLDPQQKESYSTAGAMHVLAVSGLHVGVILLILQYILSPLRRWGMFYIALLLIGIWSFALLTGFSSSVIRAATMFSLVGIGNVLYRKHNIYHTILTSAFLLLLFDPSLLFDVGFQLSYIAVIGIVYLQPKIYTWLYVKNKYLDKVWQITAVSIAAQIATFPLSAYYFHVFPTYFFITNLFVIPMAVIILYIGIALLFTFWVETLAYWLVQLLQGVIWVMNEAVSWVEQLPFSRIDQIRFYFIDALLLYGLIFFFLAAMKQGKKSLKWIAVTTALLFFGQRMVYDFYRYQQNEWMVMHSRQTPIQTFIDGHHAKWYTDSGLESEFSYISGGLTTYYGLISNQKENEIPHIFNYKGVKIMNYNQYMSHHFVEQSPDYIVLSADAFIPYDELEQLNPKTFFIIDGTNSYTYRKTIKGILKSLGFQYHDTSQRGAFLFDF